MKHLSMRWLLSTLLVISGLGAAQAEIVSTRYGIGDTDWDIQITTTNNYSYDELTAAGFVPMDRNLYFQHFIPWWSTTLTNFDGVFYAHVDAYFESWLPHVAPIAITDPPFPDKLVSCEYCTSYTPQQGDTVYVFTAKPGMPLGDSWMIEEGVVFRQGFGFFVKKANGEWGEFYNPGSKPWSVLAGPIDHIKDQLEVYEGPLDAIPIFMIRLGPVVLDEDGDGVVDAEDNCAADPNPDQRDLDADGVGDACDNCFLANSDQLDENANDIGDICDALDDFVGGGPVQDTINALTDRVDTLEAGQAAQDQTIADQQSQIDSLQTTVGKIENLPTIKKLLEKVQELDAAAP